MLKETKDNMIEEMLLAFNYTVSEYDSFYNRYRKLPVESIRQVYLKLKEGKLQSRYELEKALSKKLEYEKRRLHANHKKSSKAI